MKTIKTMKRNNIIKGLAGLAVCAFALFPATTAFGQTFNVWEKIGSGTTNHLRGISMYSTNFGVAVGANRTVLQWNGTEWLSMSGLDDSIFNPAVNLYSVKVINPSLVLIGGASGSNAEGYRGLSVWNGTSWSANINGGPGGNSISKIWTDGNGLIVTSRTYATRITRYDGDNNAADIANNSKWTLPYNASSGPSLASVHGASSADLYASGLQGVVLRSTNEGTTWTSIASSVVNDGNWNAVFSLATDQAFIAGANGRFAVWNGTDWINNVITFGSLTAAQTTWNDIFALDANNIWMVGNTGAVKYFNGTDWSDIHLPGVGNWSLYDIEYDGTSLWIAGNNGLIYQAVPEPGTAVLVITGIFTAAALRKWQLQR